MELYEIAYREAQRALDDQQVELRGMRDRSVQFTALLEPPPHSLSELGSILRTGIPRSMLWLLLPQRSP